MNTVFLPWFGHKLRPTSTPQSGKLWGFYYEIRPLWRIFKYIFYTKATHPSDLSTLSKWKTLTLYNSTTLNWNKKKTFLPLEDQQIKAQMNDILILMHLWILFWKWNFQFFHKKTKFHFFNMLLKKSILPFSSESWENIWKTIDACIKLGADFEP